MRARRRRDGIQARWLGAATDGRSEPAEQMIRVLVGHFVHPSCQSIKIRVVAILDEGEQMLFVVRKLLEIEQDLYRNGPGVYLREKVL